MDVPTHIYIYLHISKCMYNIHTHACITKRQTHVLLSIYRKIYMRKYFMCICIRSRPPGHYIFRNSRCPCVSEVIFVSHIMRCCSMIEDESSASPLIRLWIQRLYETKINQRTQGITKLHISNTKSLIPAWRIFMLAIWNDHHWEGTCMCICMHVCMYACMYVSDDALKSREKSSMLLILDESKCIWKLTTSRIRMLGSRSRKVQTMMMLRGFILQKNMGSRGSISGADHTYV